MDQQSKSVLRSTEQILDLLEKYLTPHEESFRTAIIESCPNAALGEALLASMLATQLRTNDQLINEERNQLHKLLADFVLEYVVSVDILENPIRENLN